MGRFNFTALRVHRRALQEMEIKPLADPPVWVDVVGKIPPAQIFIRKAPQVHRDIRQETRPRRAKRSGEGKSKQSFERVQYEVVHRKAPKVAFKPRNMIFFGDEIRERFYREHPWELARPRIILEKTGNDHSRCNWSEGIEQHQRGKKLDGESVVQRTCWLKENKPDMSISRAYDMARREFYKARHFEDVERRIAVEEARYVGAQFGPDLIHWGMKKEDEQYDEWELWSRQQVIEKEQRKAAFSGDITGAAPAAESDEASLGEGANDAGQQGSGSAAATGGSTQESLVTPQGTEKYVRSPGNAA